MDLQPLYEVKERLQNCLLAGLSLIDEDFRLKRAVEQFAPLSSLSPVFGKIQAGLLKLLNPETSDRGGVLMDCLALLSAVCYTQGQTDIEGELAPLRPAGGMAYIQAPYSELKPLCDALTQTGSGRYEILRQAVEMKSSILRDFRIFPLLIQALGDHYSEIAELAKGYLTTCGEGILPMLKQGFDPKGGKGMVRRLQVVETLAAQTENEWYRSLLEEADKEVRIEAIHALRFTQENGAFLCDLVRSEKGNAQKSARWALAEMEAPECLALWQKELKKKPAQTAPFLRLSTKDGVSDLIAEALAECILRLRKQNTVTKEEEAVLSTLLDATLGKDSMAMNILYGKMLDSELEAELDGLRTENGKPLRFDVSGSDGLSFSERLEEAVLDSIVYADCPRLCETIQALYAKGQEPRLLALAFAAALLTKSKEEVWEDYGGLIQKEGLIKKEGTSGRQARLQILRVLGMISWDEEKERYQMRRWYYDGQAESYRTAARNLKGGLDDRWFSLLTDSNVNRSGSIAVFNSHSLNREESGAYDEVLFHLVSPQNQAILGPYFYRRVQQTKDCITYYRPLIACGWTDFQDMLCAYASKKGQIHYREVRDFLDAVPLSNAQKAEEWEMIQDMIRTRKVKAQNGFWPETQIQQCIAALRGKADRQTER